MSDRIKLQWQRVDVDCGIEAVDGGIALDFRVTDSGAMAAKMVLDHESAWLLADELSRVVTRALLARNAAMREA